MGGNRIQIIKNVLYSHQIYHMTLITFVAIEFAQKMCDLGHGRGGSVDLGPNVRVRSS